ncbi:MAG: glycine--tRNA ligase subunit beta [Deltaproteobacteria bacterium GWC2_42_11]|nr:MAG: glycine--tRNA ligase subunit beta [Deltaproteobacteria bacterium GWC2_42_11]HBO84389.1 glycine--tRNA ligase subunit beta [Deltaproteobacteria bacterium]
MAKDLLIEIGTEEIPAGFIPKALESFSSLLKTAFTEKNINFQNIAALGTPRRLTIHVSSLDEKQPDSAATITGPAKKAAFDENGNPTKAGEGFARSHVVQVKDLSIVKTEKGEYVCIKKEVKGRKTESILEETLPYIISAIPFPKTMRWGNSDISFARPIHWITALFGDKVVNFKLGHIKSGNISYGHRFLNPKPFKVDSLETYLKKTKSANVIINPSERKELIAKKVDESAKNAGSVCLQDEGLLDEVTNLVEYPVCLRGNFDKEFLSLPKEVIINAMREHQRYFSVVDKHGNLLPYFIFVANTKAKDPKIVIKGNERVLRARLNDAKFYFNKDVNIPLAQRVSALKGVIFQAKLGTSYEKVERFTRLAVHIGHAIGFCEPMNEGVEIFLQDPRSQTPDPRFILARASMLCKADLVTGMVSEFPKLQGIMGKEYALKSGESKEVADAIYEHYLPIKAEGELPKKEAGAIISIADKMDTICGCFSVGLIPTGGTDPYGLRRQALGIMAIIIDKSLVLLIDELVDKSIEILKDKIKRPVQEIKKDVLEFFKERIRNHLLSQGYSFDSTDAVLSANWYDINDAVKRIKALEGFKKNPACSALTIAFKRVSNILKGQEAGVKGQKIDTSLFEYPNEKELFEITQRIAPDINRYWKEGNYEKVFETLASLKGIIDTFFDKVMVMVEDEKVRDNRLILLNMVRNLYYQIADLSKLTT